MPFTTSQKSDYAILTIHNIDEMFMKSDSIYVYEAYIAKRSENDINLQKLDLSYFVIIQKKTKFS